MLECPLPSENDIFTFSLDAEPLLFANENSIHFPLPESGPIIEKVRMLSSVISYLLFTESWLKGFYRSHS